MSRMRKTVSRQAITSPVELRGRFSDGLVGGLRRRVLYPLSYGRFWLACQFTSQRPRVASRAANAYADVFTLVPSFSSLDGPSPSSFWIFPRCSVYFRPALRFFSVLQFIARAFLDFARPYGAWRGRFRVFPRCPVRFRPCFEFFGVP